MIKLNYIKSLFSPFKPFKLKVYCGKAMIGTPYFLPRKWVNNTPEDAKKSATNSINNPRLTKKSFKEHYDYYLSCRKAVPKTIGFDLVGLGWKTKFGEYRFEYSPLISFVFFKWQIAVMVIAPHLNHY